MILFTILLLILAILTVLTILGVAAGGAVFAILFSDVIVCIVLIALLIRFIIKRRH
jgi:hypothetical protein